MNVTRGSSADQLPHGNKSDPGVEASNYAAVFYTSATEEPQQIHYMSASVEALTGVSPDAFRAHPELLASLIHPGDRQRRMERIATHPRPLSHQFRIRRADGAYVMVIEHIHRQTLATGAGWQDIASIDPQPTHFAQDTGLNPRGSPAEDVLGMLQTARTPILIADMRSGAVVYHNEAAAKFVGSAGQKDDIRLSCFMRDRRARAELLGRLLRDSLVENFEAEITSADGSKRWANISASTTPAHHRTLVVATFSDMSVQHSHNTQADQARDRALELEREAAQKEVLGGIAHELNNPLSIILGQILLLQENTKDNCVRVRGERIRRAADRCSRIVRSFLAMAKDKPERSTDLDINDVVMEALDRAGSLLRTHHVKLDLQLTPGLPLVCGDRTTLGDAVSRLIEREVHALSRLSDVERVLRLETGLKPDSAEVFLAVRDTALTGKSAHDRKFFDPFNKVHDAQAKHSGQETTKFAIAIAQNTIQHHGGHLGVENQGHCTAFVMTLPIAETAPINAGAPADPHATQ
ncbi:MAG: PAS domain-containing protein [Gammaproteobacteria bacterium]|nr:PAS domain-containing protein [Gammaproteobacteria bacterium]